MQNTQKKTNNNIFEQYLERQKNFASGIDTLPLPNLSFCIVIPCYNEPNLFDTLTSLANNHPTKQSFEVIVVINAPLNAEKAAIDQNKKTANEMAVWSKEHNTKTLQFYSIIQKSTSIKKAGVGLARKTGMDEAVNRFMLSQNYKGVIISLDADTICPKTYLSDIESFYNQYTNAIGCNFNFEHVLNSIADPSQRESMAQYELYLRYFSEALRSINYPFPFHTIGSCFSVKASVYCKQGGMNSKQAGEDFYFLQKIFTLGGFFELNNIIVYPSSRISNRVIFGTGPSLLKLTEENKNLFVYSYDAFLLINDFLNIAIVYFSYPQRVIDYIDKNDSDLITFLKSIKVLEKLDEIKNNVSSEKPFTKRFFQVFNNFFMVKALNHLSRTSYSKEPVRVSILKMLSHQNININGDNTIDLLNYFREKQKNRSILPQQL